MLECCVVRGVKWRVNGGVKQGVGRGIDVSGRECVVPVGEVATATEPPLLGMVLLDLAKLLP